MNLKPTNIILALILSFLPRTVWAQTHSDCSLELGTFHSYKAVGFCADLFTSDDQFDTFELTADMHEVFSGKRPVPGIRASYIHNIILKEFSVREGETAAQLYAGPGVTAGYIRDSWKPFGVMAGITGALGVRANFLHNISLSAELGIDVALFAQKDARYGNIDLTLYEAGIKNIIYPQLKISYRL